MFMQAELNTTQQILSLITPFVSEGKILPRTEADIRQNLDDYVLLFEGEELVACAGLKDCQEGAMGEIYSLAVKQSKQDQGLSKQLLDKLLEKAKQEGFHKIFALSKHGGQWFIKHGFTVMKVSDLPSHRQQKFDHQRNSSIYFKDVN